jgi:HrpA-like RNA helicase
MSDGMDRLAKWLELREFARKHEAHEAPQPHNVDDQREVERNAFYEALRRGLVTFVHGETGSGKSTQVPQFLLDNPNAPRHMKILMALPRRLAVTSLAERITNERNKRYSREDKVGDEVGHRIGKDHADSKSTKLLIVTVGYLLRHLTDPKRSPESTSRYTHIILDEVLPPSCQC